MRADLLDLVRRLLDAQEPFARATVVRRRAPTSSRLGDTAVITRDGEFHGWIGGSCTTPEVIRQALETIRAGSPRLLAFGFDAAGPGDENVVRVPMTCQSGGSVEVYIEPMIPAPRLLVAGTSPISRALVRIGSAMGWSVWLLGAAGKDEYPAAEAVVESLRELPDALTERPDSSRLFTLVATMGRADERTILELLELRPDYLGVIASPTRMSEIHERLEDHGVEATVLASIRGPAGLDLGGTTPEEIAVSVLAEMVQEYRAAAAARDDVQVEESAANASAGNASVEETTAGAVSAWAKDPVCGMTIEADGSRPTAEHGGVAYHFCCEGCRDRFVADPAAYLEGGTGLEAGS